VASIRKRGDKWEVRVTRKGQGSTSKSFTLKADAEKYARQIESVMDRGEWSQTQSADDAPLVELIERYRQEITPSKKGAAVEVYRLKRWAASPLAKLSVRRIKAADIAKARDERIKEGKSPATVRLELAALSSVFRQATLEWGYEGLTNPCMGIKRPPPAKGRERRLHEGELNAILKATQSDILPTLCQLAIETASRMGELLALDWRFINLKARTATFVDTKNGDRRVIPLSPRAIELLSAIPPRLDNQRLFEVTNHAASRAWIRAVKRARIAYEKICHNDGEEPKPDYLKDLHFHDLRHEGVSRLFEIGLDASEVMSISGHKTMTMLSRYTHHKAERLAEKLSKAA
jgi:integrase